MDKRKIRDYIKVIGTVVWSWAYIPHLLTFYSMGGAKRIIMSDIATLLTRSVIKIPKWFGLIFYLHTNRFYRTLFYHRIGPVRALLIEWLRPGDRYFIISKTTQIGQSMLFAHPYATILNAESIGSNFNCRHMTTLGDKNGKRPIIGNNVNLGANVTIIGGVKVGDNVSVGAGSVVVKDIPSNTVVAGNPARIIKYLQTSS